MVNATGYDPDNRDQAEYLERLISGEPVSIPGTGKRYIAQSWKGTEPSNTQIRMIEEETYRAVEQREAAWAEAQGLFKTSAGRSYWRGFMKNGTVFDGVTPLRKYYDSLNKNWSPSVDARANFDGKQFAIISLTGSEGEKIRKYADGQAFWGSGIMPEGLAAQIRFGIAGKGTGHDMGFRTVGEWAVHRGLIKPGERFYQTAPNGERIDVTDMNGLVDASTVKDLPMLQEAFKDNASMNRAFTAMLQRYG